VFLSEQNLHFARAVSDRALIIEKGAIRYDGSLARSWMPIRRSARNIWRFDAEIAHGE
jgi:ABC-type branched-subunit amino acid transport system ATPase component